MREAMLDTWREHVKFLEEQHKRVEALFKAGAEGGNKAQLEMAEYELARAQFELSLAEGKAGSEARPKLEIAVQAAKEAFEAYQARYEAGQISANTLYAAAAEYYEARRLLLQFKNAQANALPVSQPDSGDAPRRLAPGDTFFMSAIGVATDAPISGHFTVEPGGTIALGPLYGRAKVGGLSLEDAEHAISVHLREDGYKDAKVQITQLNSYVPPSAPTAENQLFSPAAPLAAPTLFDRAQGNTTRQPAPDGRSDLARELNQVASAPQPTESLRVLKAILQLKEQELNHVVQLANAGQVPQTEVAVKRAEFEVARARVQQAQRAAQYRKEVVAVAEKELEIMLEANKKAPNTVSQIEVDRATLQLELARLQYAELAE
jgi:hypothetical protein